MITPHNAALISMNMTICRSIRVKEEGQTQSGDEKEHSAGRFETDEYEETRAANGSRSCTDRARHRMRGKTPYSSVFQSIGILFVTGSNECNSTVNCPRSQTR